jgi:hypothetical protein
MELAQTPQGGTERRPLMDAVRMRRHHRARSRAHHASPSYGFLIVLIGAGMAFASGLLDPLVDATVTLLAGAYSDE